MEIKLFTKEELLNLLRRHRDIMLFSVHVVSKRKNIDLPLSEVIELEKSIMRAELRMGEAGRRGEQ